MDHPNEGTKEEKIMLSINMDDVIKVLNSIKSQLIGFGVVAVLLIAVMIACRKQSKAKKYMIRWQAGLGLVLALAITVNLIHVHHGDPGHRRR